MDVKQDSPVIVITALAECQPQWQEVLWGIEEEGIPRRWQQASGLMSSPMHGRRPTSQHCWLASPAITSNWLSITEIYPHQRRFYADAS